MGRPLDGAVSLSAAFMHGRDHTTYGVGLRVAIERASKMGIPTEIVELE